MANDNLTVVISARKPDRVLVFDNPDRLSVKPVVVRNGSDLGELEVRYVLDQPGTVFTATAAPLTFLKGDEGWGAWITFNDWIIWATAAGDNHTLVPAVRTNIDDVGRYQYLMVGTTAANARNVFILQDQ